MSSLSYIECEIDRGVVAAAKRTFEELHATISGRAGEHNTITQPVGFEFSDLIGSAIRAKAEENFSAWSSSMMACQHAFGVLHKVGEDVKWYEEEIEDIKARLATALSNASDSENITVVNGIVETYNQEADKAWRDLEEKFDVTESNLKGGPTPENIRELAEGGHLGEYGQIGYYTTKDLDYFYVDEAQAETIIIHIKNAVIDGHGGSIEALEDNSEYLALINNVVARAQEAQQNGGELSEGEIDFLEKILGDLSDPGADDPSFLDFVDEIDSSEHISDSLKRELKNSLSNSMLVLSDEGIGGGVEFLPEDVREVAFGNNVQPVGGAEDDNPDNNATQNPDSLWKNSFIELSDFLDNSNVDVSGGTDFSVALLASSSLLLDQSGVISPQWNESLQATIDVATRNPEASNVMITGEDFDGNKFDHHENHQSYSPERFLEIMYSHEWEDGGEAVSGLTDWISEDAASPEDRVPIDETSEIRPDLSPEEERSARALAALVEMMENESFRDSVFSTGAEVTEEDGATWRDVAAGHLNPNIADSWADIFISYMDVFGNTEGLGNAGGNLETRWDEDQNRVYLNPEGRKYFMELVMGDEGSAQKAYSEVVYYGTQEMENFALAGDGRDYEGADRYGSLLGLVDSALESENSRRTEDDKKAVEHANNVRNAVVDTMGGFAGDRGASGLFVEIAKFLAKESIKIQDNPPDSNRVESHGGWMPEENMKVLAVSALAAGDSDVMDALEELHPGAVKGEGDDRYIPLDQNEWDINGEYKSSALVNMYDHVDELPWVDGGGTTKSAIDNYLGALGMAWSKW
ncbi:hypothetical protein [Nocardiopsis alba]|uniref:TPR repeat region-containing protein n=1 Tax=Nocardiopsis alba TaxID=53437 RepID=UPI0033A78588